MPPLRSQHPYQTRSVAKLPAELVVEGFQPSDQTRTTYGLRPLTGLRLI